MKNQKEYINDLTIDFKRKTLPGVISLVFALAVICLISFCVKHYADNENKKTELNKNTEYIQSDDSSYNQTFIQNYTQVRYCINSVIAGQKSDCEYLISDDYMCEYGTKNITAKYISSADSSHIAQHYIDKAFSLYKNELNNYIDVLNMGELISAEYNNYKFILCKSNSQIIIIKVFDTSISGIYLLKERIN